MLKALMDFAKLSRRERQIMDAVFEKGEATVHEVRDRLPEAPTSMAVRRMMLLLEEKGILKKRREGREFVYQPCQTKRQAGAKALKHVLDTFFSGALDQAVATHLAQQKVSLSDTQRHRLQSLIDEAEKSGH